MAYSPFTSKGYPFPKDREKYDSYRLGRAFFADGFTDDRRALYVFDHIDLLNKPYIKDQPLFYKGTEVPVTVYSTDSVTTMEAEYKKLDLAYDEIAVFLVQSPTDPANPLSTGVFATVFLGESMLKYSKLDEAEMRTKRFPVEKEDLDKLRKEVSAKGIITILNKDNALFAEDVEDIMGLAPKAKPKVHFTIGMFFDGTGNNRFNSDAVYYQNLIDDKDYGKIVNEKYYKDNERLLVTDPETRKSNTIKVTTDSSYWNPYSNVVLLHDLYEESNRNATRKEKDGSIKVTIKQYVQGIGTLRMEEDDIFGSGLAEGQRGIINKVEDGCAGISKQIKEVLGSDYQIGSLTFDVFGFSCGAAAARHFCNEILGPDSIEELHRPSVEKLEAKYEELLRADYHHTPIAVTHGDANRLHYYKYSLGRLGEALSKKDDRGIKVEYYPEKVKIGDSVASAVNIRFLGVFETVVSQMLVKEHLGHKLALLIRSIIPAIIEKLFDRVRQNVQGLGIEKIFHIIAEDERRKNFPITYAKEGVELKMPGAHSDVGGGYAAIAKERNILDFFAIVGNDYGSDVIGAEEIDSLNFYKNKGYCSATQIDFVKGSKKEIPMFFSKKYLKLIVQFMQLISTRILIPRYSAIPLHVMANVARDNDVPFSDPEKGNSKYSFEYKVPKELLKYKNAVSDNAKKQMDEKYLKIKKPLSGINKDDKSLILSKFVHLSANYNKALYFDRKDRSIFGIKSADKIMYANHPTDDLKRKTYDHGK